MEEVNVIIVNGYPRSGKDSFVNFCLNEEYNFGYAISTVDFIKEIAYKAGWDGDKTPQARKALSDLKAIFTEWLDTPYNEVRRKIRNIERTADSYGLHYNKFFLFVHSREPEEIARFVKDFNAITVFVERAQNDVDFSNSSDQNVADYEYDFVITNDGSLTDLKEMARIFLAKVKNERGIK